LECFKNSLELSKRIGFEGHVFYSYVNLCKASLKLYDYRNAFEYFNQAVNELEKYPVQRKSSTGEYYRIGGELFYAIGVLDKAQEYALKAFEIYKNDEFLSKWHTEALIEFIKLLKCKDAQGISECIERIRIVNQKYASNTEKANNLYVIGMIAYGNGQSQLADEIFN
jgi:tetratricopeptide (TPR) repeat protein